jgi:hypothetical protein
MNLKFYVLKLHVTLHLLTIIESTFWLLLHTHNVMNLFVEMKLARTGLRQYENISCISKQAFPRHQRSHHEGG